MQKGIVDIMQIALVGSRQPWRFLATLLFCLLVGVVGGAILALLTPIYTAALVIGLMGGVLMLQDTQWGLIAVIAIICLLPFAAVPLNMGFEPTFLDLALVATFFVWLARIATRRQGPLIGSALALPIIAFVAIIITSFIAGLAHASITLTLLRRFAELILGVLTFFLVINCVRTRTQLRQLVLVLILAGAAASLIGVFLYVLPEEWAVRALSALRVVRYPAGSGVLRYVEDNPDLPLRAISTSQDPNVLGGLLILVTGLTVPQLFSRQPLLPRKYLATMAGVMFLCLVLTYSRGAMAGLAVGLLAISILRYRRLGWLIVAGAMLFLLLPQTQVYVERFAEGVQGEDLATQMRFGEYRDALTLILRHPWLGVGFAGVPEIYLYLGVSNVYLLIGEETGLIGLGSFLLIIAVLLTRMWRARRAARSDPSLDATFWGLSAALLGALAGGVLDHYFFNMAFPHAATLFWLYVGLAVVTMRLAESAEQAHAV